MSTFAPRRETLRSFVGAMYDPRFRKVVLRLQRRRYPVRAKA